MNKKLAISILFVLVFFSVLGYFRGHLSNIVIVIAAFFGTIFGIIIQFYLRND